MSKTITLTEQDLKEIIKQSIEEFIFDGRYGLLEGQHYPEFLDNFKIQITSEIINELKKLPRPDTFTIDVHDYDYVKKIRVVTEVINNDDINNEMYYTANYDSLGTEFKNKSLCIGVITLFFPIDMDGNTNYDLIEETIYHELNHIYDDYTKRKYDVEKGREPKPLGDNLHLQAVNTMIHDNLLDDLGFLAYYNAKTEEQAFLSTVPKELEYRGANRDNIQTLMRTIPTYSQIYQHHRTALSFLKDKNKWSDDVLIMVNDKIRDRYPDAGVPYCKMYVVPDEYRKKLIAWCESVYDRFIKRYYSVVQYYLDNKVKNVNESRYFPHFRYDNIKIGHMENFDKRRGLEFLPV